MTATDAAKVDWLLFLLLGFFRGSSYLFIKIGVEAGLPTFTLVALRLLIGSALLGTVVLIAREPLPRELRFYGHISVVAFFGIAMPFVLITLAEANVSSAVASVLTAPVPLFAILFAALLLPGESLNVRRLAGVVVGLLGVAVLVGFDAADLGNNDFYAELALVTAAMCYAIGAVYARRFVPSYRPMVPALFEVFFALVMVAPVALLFEDPLGRPIAAEALLSVAWLGLIGTGLAFLVFFRLLASWGPARTTLVAYTLPVWGIVLGAVVLREEIPRALIEGTVLIIFGIALVNLHREAVVGTASWLRSRVRARHWPDSDR